MLTASVLELEPQSGSIGDEPVQLAFLDSKIILAVHREMRALIRR